VQSYKSTATESLTVLSAFSLITPPTQWILKDSFLHRRLKFEQWGVPISKDMKKNTARRLHSSYSKSSALQLEKAALETALQERLVWIRYQDKYWWPAIVYDNYRQLIHDETLSKNVWYRMPFWKRFQLASLLVFRADDQRNHTQVARLLGRGTTNDNGTGGSLEIIEVEDTWPFKDESKVTQVIGEMALNGDYFRSHPSLYLEWHRAMDQMEQLLGDCLGIDLDHLEAQADPQRRDAVEAVADEKRKKEKKERRQRQTSDNGGIAAAEEDLDDNSLVASMVNNSQQKFDDPSVGIDQYDDEHDAVSKATTSIHEGGIRRRKTWVERAKEAEQKQWVAQCQSCSDFILDSVEGACEWKDSRVATWFEQPPEATPPHRLERRRTTRSRSRSRGAGRGRSGPSSTR
jgi:hypothetical protein